MEGIAGEKPGSGAAVGGDLYHRGHRGTQGRHGRGGDFRDGLRALNGLMDVDIRGTSIAREKPHFSHRTREMGHPAGLTETPF
jgi:hypothetical protein